jgi:hypothetical protein
VRENGGGSKKSVHKYNKKAKMGGQGGEGGMEWPIGGVCHLYNSVLECIMMGNSGGSKKIVHICNKKAKMGGRGQGGVGGME